MKAIGYTVNGAIDRADALIDLEVEKPTATGHDILVKVEAVSVNPIDTKIRQSRAAEGGTPVILGWDAWARLWKLATRSASSKLATRSGMRVRSTAPAPMPNTTSLMPVSSATRRKASKRPPLSPCP